MVSFINIWLLKQKRYPETKKVLKLKKVFLHHPIMSILLNSELQAQGCLEVRRELNYGFDSAMDIIYTLGDTIFDDMRI